MKQLPSEVNNLVCRIYLGDEENYEEHGRKCFKKPFLESPVISFGMHFIKVHIRVGECYIGQRVKEKKTQRKLIET